MKILSLEAQNILRIKAVHIVPEGPLVVIGGENKQGKTSILEAIRMACGGARALPTEPVHRGATEGSVRLDLGDLVVEFTVDKTGGSVVVRNADGKKQSKPQAILDRLFDKIAFNPELFAKQAKEDPKKAVETLKKLVGLDFSALDAERAQLYEKRTGVGNVRSDAEVRISQFPATCLNAPDDEVSVADLLAKKEAADKQNLANQKVRDSYVRLSEAATESGRIAEKAQRDYETAKANALAAANALEALKDVATADLVTKIGSAESINRMVRDKKDRAKAVATFTEKDREYISLTKKIEAIDESKRQQLAAAKWPVTGLGFGDNGITFNGLPFEQASQSEARVVSFSVGAALNPDLRVALIDDGEKLDKSSMRQLAQLADEKDMQVWIERVGDGDAGAIIIEDGEVANDLDNVPM
jgi:predicted ATP-dependent endonuclease of OLD family